MLDSHVVRSSLKLKFDILKQLQYWKKTSNSAQNQVTIIFQNIRYQFLVYLGCNSLHCVSWALCLGVGNKEMLGSSGFGSRWQYLVYQRGSGSENFQNGQTILDFAHGIINLMQAWSSGCSLWKFVVGNRQNMKKSFFW